MHFLATQITESAVASGNASEFNFHSHNIIYTNWKLTIENSKLGAGIYLLIFHLIMGIST